jgi:hypothetical protein
VSVAPKTVSQKKTAPAKAPTRKAPAKKASTARKAPARPAAKKPASPSRTVKTAKPVADKPVKVKLKLVRDGFTMPANDFALIEVLKERLLNARRPTKKSELLRAGLHALAALQAEQLLATVNALEPLKTGRPKNDA